MSSPSRIKGPQYFGFIAIVAALVGTTAAFWTATSQRDRLRNSQYSQEELRTITARDLASLRDTEERLDSIKHQTDELTVALQESEHSGKVIKYSEGLGPRDRQTIEHLRDMQSRLDQRLSGLEAAILQNPEKAIGLPMLKQQITDIQDRMHGDVDSIHGEISRVYGLVQVLLGLMFTLILGIASLIFNVLKSTEKPRAIAPEPQK